MNQSNEWQGLFEHSPVSLWLEDYSGVKTYLDSLRASGVTDLTAHLAAHPEDIDKCMGQLKVLDVNAQTIALYRANSKEHLLSNLGSVFRDEMRAHFHYELMDMWNGKLTHQTEGRNYALDGTPIEIDLRWSILPGYETTWERALVSIIDISERKRAEQAQVASEEHARGLFEHSPISMWLEDYSGVKAFLDDIRAQGITDIRAYLEAHPDELAGSIARIKVLDVNHQTLVMFGAKTKEELLSQLDKVFRGDMTRHYTDELVSMWRGNLSFEGEGVNYALNGDPIDIDLRWSVMPGYEDTWERALVSLIDITARKKAEAYLKYLGTHDVLTGLYNRAYFEEERSRMQRSRQYPVSIVVADLNGLKPANDNFGHDAGDGLLRRTGEVFKATFRAEDVIARIGGDEFAILMPNTDSRAAEQAIARVQHMLDINNKFYQGAALSFSIGSATAERGEALEAVQRRADDRMYEQKREHHKAHPR